MPVMTPLVQHWSISGARRLVGQVLDEDVGAALLPAQPSDRLAAALGDQVQDVVAVPEPDEAGIDGAVPEPDLSGAGREEVVGRPLELGSPAPAGIVEGRLVVGAVPGGFRHPQQGFVDLLIMYLDLTGD